MPHLSPMNWLLAIISIWVLLASLMSLTWWSPSYTWPSMNPTSSTIKTSTWNWYNL